jgi:N-acetylglutamate synthase-like GNAT family acetyltransferase
MTSKDITIIIRDAEPDDATAISVLLAELGYPQEPASVRGWVKRLSKRIKDRVLVAVNDNEVVAVLSLHILPLFHTGRDVCRITSLVVAQKHRNKYIGQRMIQMVEAYARANGCISVEITSHERREDAHAFYKKLGYEEAPKRLLKNL